MERAQLKTQAKAQIKGKIGILFVITLIIAALSSLATAILGQIPVIGSLAATVIVTPAFSLSVYRIYLALFQGSDVKVADAFSGFDDFWAAFKVTFLVGLFTFLWSLLFVIPGIVKSYSYSMAMYILAENKGKPALECIEESKEMTHGHKMELFVLSLSFIGWIFLGAITLGIAYIWIIPYMNATMANAYHSLKPVVVTQSVAEPVAQVEEAVQQVAEPVVEATVVEVTSDEEEASTEQ